MKTLILLDVCICTRREQSLFCCCCFLSYSTIYFFILPIAPFWFICVQPLPPQICSLDMLSPFISQELNGAVTSPPSRDIPACPFIPEVSLAGKHDLIKHNLGAIAFFLSIFPGGGCLVG